MNYLLIFSNISGLAIPPIFQLRRQLTLSNPLIQIQHRCCVKVKGHERSFTDEVIESVRGWSGTGSHCVSGALRQDSNALTHTTDRSESSNKYKISSYQ